MPLALAFNVSQLANGACSPLPGATVDIWQCDASGDYSRAEEPFLRGVQATGANGKAAFTTIYPGWYHGRAVHIHAKIRTTAPSGAYEFTTQMFFDDGRSDAVHARAAP